MPASQDDNHLAWLFGIGLVLAVITIMSWRTLRVPTRLGPLSTGVSASDLDALLPYLQARTDPAHPMDLRAEGVAVARDPFIITNTPLRVSMPTNTTPKSTALGQGWSVTAVLITDSRRAAVINDVLVNLGGQLPGGSRLTGVERDHVIVTDANGARRTINVNDGNG